MSFKVKDIMNTYIEKITQDATVFEAMKKMVEKKIRSLLVLPSNEKDLYGVLTVRDIVHNVLGKNLDMKKTKVGEVATKRVVCVDKETKLEDFIQLMEKFNIGRVFVNEGKDIIGVASLFDIIHFFLTKEEERI
jgi:CBS domain-containing protein